MPPITYVIKYGHSVYMSHRGGIRFELVTRSNTQLPHLGLILGCSYNTTPLIQSYRPRVHRPHGAPDRAVPSTGIEPLTPGVVNFPRLNLFTLPGHASHDQQQTLYLGIVWRGGGGGGGGGVSGGRSGVRLTLLPWIHSFLSLSAVPSS